MAVIPARFMLTLERHSLFPLVRSWVAVCGVFVVLGLVVLTASPELHQELHGHVGAHDEGCPVALFAGGVATPVALCVTDPVALPVPLVCPFVAEEIFLSSPRYLRRPERGPPALG
jgi:hypothetical protein